MQAFGAVIGTFVAAYIMTATVHLLRQCKSARIRNEMTLELLKEQILAASVQRIHREQEQLLWNGTRKFVVDKKVKETGNTCSYYLTSQDKKPLPLFKPGQFLTFRLHVPGHDKSVVRCYTISSRPNCEYYRITVKRAPGGVGSGYLHNEIDAGAILDVQAPRGKFFIDPSLQKPLVLIAGGVGITPTASMMSAIIDAQSSREVNLFYSVTNGREHILKRELESLVEGHENIRMSVLYSNPDDLDSQGRDFDFRGRISVGTLKEMLPSNNYDFYLCGPRPMTESLKLQLQDWGVPDGDIFTEAFGTSADEPASTKSGHQQRTTGEQTPDSNSKPKKIATVSTDQAKVVFSKSGRADVWDGSDNDLLSLASKNGVDIQSGCGSGSCGSCQTGICSGKVKYQNEPCFSCEEQSCLPCVAVPDGDLVLDV